MVKFKKVFFSSYLAQDFTFENHMNEKGFCLNLLPSAKQTNAISRRHEKPAFDHDRMGGLPPKDLDAKGMFGG